MDEMEVQQQLHVDPFSCGFATLHDVDGAKYGHLVEDLLKGSQMYEKVQSGLQSEQGCFDDSKALEIFEHIVRHIYDLFPDWNEEDDGASNHIWALGVILYFMLCGCPASKEIRDCQNNWYQNLHLGKPSKEYRGRKRRWCDLSLNARKFLKQLLHYNPAYRPALGWMMATSVWANEVSDVHYLLRLWGSPSKDHDADESEGASATKDAGKENCRTITLAQEEEMKRLKEATERRRNEESTATKRQWNTFFGEATKLSKKKKRKLNAVKRNEKKKKKEVEDCLLKYWEQLYWDRHKSHTNLRRYLNTPVPEWLESDDFYVDASFEVLRRTDLKYDGEDFHRYKLFASHIN